MSRRKEYKNVGDSPRYDFWLDKFRMESTILRGQNTQKQNLSDLQGCRAVLASLVGNLIDKPGYFLREGYRKVAKKPSLLTDEKIVHLEWANYQQQVVNSGKRLPVIWTDELLEKLLKVQAALDILDDEIKFVEKKIAELSAIPEGNEDFLPNGLQGWVKTNSAGVVRLVDGMKVILVNGKPTFSEGLFEHMETADYFDFILPAFRAQQKEQDGLILIQMNKEEKARGESLTPEFISGPKRVRRSSLPQWSDFPDIKPNLPKEMEVVTAPEPKETPKVKRNVDTWK